MRVTRLLGHPLFAAFLVHASLAVVITWPLARDLDDRLPIGQESVATVPLFNTWTMWWNADRLEAGLDGYWQAPIFAPHPDTFAFSETQPTTLLLAPVVWSTGSPFVATNVYLLLLLTLNGLVTWIVLRALGFRLLPAWTGSLLVELLPFIHWQLGVLQLAAICPIIAALGLWVRVIDRPRLRTGCALGAAMACVYLANHHYGVFLVILLTGALPFLHGWRLPTRKRLAAIGVAGTAAGLLALPIAWKQWRVAEAERWQRPEDFVAELSAQPVDYLVSPARVPNPLSHFVPAERRDSWRLGTGLLQMLLGAAGAVVGISTRRRWSGFLTVMAVLAFLLSLGPTWSLGGFRPYGLAARVVPGLEFVRNAFRFAVFVQLAWVLLSVVALEQFDELLRKPTFGANRPVLRPALVAALSLLLCIEAWPEGGELYDVERFAARPSWVQWLAQNAPPDSIVLCLPVPAGDTVYDYESATIWMAWSMFHERPLVNGYSGFFPLDYWNLQMSIRQSNGQVLRQLQQRAVRWCVVDLDANGMGLRTTDAGPYPVGWIPGLTPAEHAALRVAFCDADSRVAIFEIFQPSPPVPARAVFETDALE